MVPKATDRELIFSSKSNMTPPASDSITDEPAPRKGNSFSFFPMGNTSRTFNFMKGKQFSSEYANAVKSESSRSKIDDKSWKNFCDFILSNFNSIYDNFQEKRRNRNFDNFGSFEWTRFGNSRGREMSVRSIDHAIFRRKQQVITVLTYVYCK